MPGSSRQSSGTWLRLAPSGALTLVGAVVSAVLLQRAFVAAHRTIGWTVACGVVALLLEPIINYLDRRVPRAIAIIGTVVAVAAIAAVLSFLVLRQLGDSISALRTSAPEAAQRLENKVKMARDLQLGLRVREFVDSIDARLRSEALQRLGTVPTYVITGIMMLFFLTYGRRYVRAALRQISDESVRASAQRVLHRGFIRGRGYLLWTILQTAIFTLIAEVVFRALDLPADLVLALLVGVVGAIPLFGVAVGGMPALLVAYGFQGAGTAMVVLAVLAVLQIAEGFVVRPWVDRRSVAVGPFAPLTAGLLGYSLYGGGGAVYGYALAVLGVAMFDAFTYDRRPT